MFERSSTSSRRRKAGLGAAVAVLVGSAGIGGMHIADAASEPVTADEAQVYVALSPVRIMDTRDPGGTQFGPKEIRTLSFSAHVPPEATAVVVNTTVDRATGQTFLTMWPTGEPMPNASVNNPEFGIVTPNEVVARLGTNSSVDIYNDRQSADVIVDLAGYFLPMSDVAGFGIAGSATDVGTPLAPIALPTAVLANATYETVTTFTAPTDGTFVLDASVDVQYASGTAAVGTSATAVCRWTDGRNIERGSTITADALGVPGLERANIGVPGIAADVTAGDTVELECRTDQVLVLGSEVVVSAAYTAIEVDSIS